MQLELNNPEIDNERATLYAEVVIPLAVEGTFTYRVPYKFNELVAVGKRVTVQFGARHIYSGIVTEVHERIPSHNKTKYLLEVTDDAPLLSSAHLEFWQWVARYYLCNLGEVMDAAFPAYMKLKSETTVVLHPGIDPEEFDLKGTEALVIEALQHENELTLSSIQKLLNIGNIMPVVRSLHYKGLVLTLEDVKSKFRPRVEKYIKLQPAFEDEETLSATFQVLEQKKSTQKQSQLLVAFVRLAQDDGPVLKKRLLEQEDTSASSLKSLINKGILVEYEVQVDRWKIAASAPQPFTLNDTQAAALKSIETSFEEAKPVLLHGVTGSGKTHIYIQLMEKLLAAGGGQILYLVPEIALTTQLIDRLAKYLGRSIAVYHSRLNNNERYELWQGIKNGKYDVVVGARSSVFLPFENLKLIIVDEEHEASFKQQDPAPRYNARDIAIYLSRKFKINILLGSATPSIESFYNAQSNKYDYIFLNGRFGDVQMPSIHLIDLKKEQKNKSIHQNLSRELKMAMEKCLAEKNQVILFQNRRGYAPILECGTCGWVPYCKNCDIILTYHKYNQTLSCHYCGYSTGLVSKCGSCGNYDLKMKGTGTERIEDELELLYPEKHVARMDLDTTRRKNSLENIISGIERGEIDILVGTQMVTKGLDFEKVKLVGVISGDSMMYQPDFRATERAFQILTQVAGRSGRKGARGEVAIQTYQPEHFIYQLLIQQNHKDFYATELQQRKQFRYPPYFRLIKIKTRHKSIEKVNEVADLLFRLLATRLGKPAVFGPEFSSTPRLKNRYHKFIHLKMTNDAKAIANTKNVLKSCIDHLKSNPKAKSVDFVIDVDPY